MVGVAGKSQGCNTCRKRKVKCDKGRPFCDRCHNSKRECGGYQRNRYFKNLSALDHDMLLERKQPRFPRTEPSILRYDGLSCEPKETLEQEASNQLEIASPDPDGPGTRSTPTTLSELFAHFLSNYNPKGEIKRGDPPVSWLDTVLNSAKSEDNTVLNLAITALSLVRLGRKHQSQELQTEGIAIYGQALEKVHGMLSNADFVFQEQTLASCMTLSIFEVLETSGSNVQGWISHVDGLSRLFQLRGPELHIEETSHLLFLGFRPTGIVYALAIRKASYLGEESWLSTPWKIHEKSDFDRLLDVIAQIPAIMEQTEHQISLDPSSTSSQTLVLLLSRNYAIEEKLRKWYDRLVGSAPETLYTDTPSKNSPQEATWQVPSRKTLTFFNFEIARVHLYYWSALLLIYNNLSSLLSHPIACQNQFPQLTYLNLSLLTYQSATLITQSIPYLLSPEAHILGPQNVFFPLRTAMHAFEYSEGMETEMKWCRDVFDELDSRGFPFGKILAEVKWEDIPRFLSSWTVES